jgi:2-polyprenyl-6-hydroxyphenyl methylase/3-demethylubiquinone-9 3-methyltransferase
MPVDNEIYDRLADTWWDDRGFLGTLREALLPARLAYVRHSLTRVLGPDLHAVTALDVGCGGGVLAEELARLGCRVTGVEPSPASVESARRHAVQEELDIDYREGVGEELPVEAESFDAVVCCDVLEHVADVARVVAECARVLRPGGVFIFDTINRTLPSTLVMIKLCQEWRATSFLPPRVHDWNMFVRPDELRELLALNGITPCDVTGMRPGTGALALVRTLRQRKRGELSHVEAGRRLQVAPSRLTTVHYMGYGTKAMSTRTTGRHPVVN